jgi:hypothetical protein
MVDLVRFGYFFFPSHYRPPLGYSAFDAYLCEPRTDWYFDTQAATFPVVTDEATRHLRIVHPWPLAPQRLQVVFGRFYLVAHNGELIEGCSLGGTLEIDDHGTHTSCHLTSPAPIFEVDDPNGFINLLESEVEAELARARAEWTGSDAEFDRRVAKMDPMTLFVASLDFLDAYLRSQPNAMANDLVMDERSALHRAIRTVQEAGLWPTFVPSLRELILNQASQPYLSPDPAYPPSQSL